MLRKLLLGLVWFVVIYFGLCALVGAWLTLAGAQDPQNAEAAGKLAGETAVTNNILFMPTFAAPGNSRSCHRNTPGNKGQTQAAVTRSGSPFEWTCGARPPVPRW